MVRVEETKWCTISTGVNIGLEEITLVLLVLLGPRLRGRLSKLQGISISCIDHFVDPFDQNVALWRDKCTEQAHEVGHGLVDCASEYPRVEQARR